MSFCVWLLTINLDEHTIPVINSVTTKGNVTGEEVLKAITNIKPSRPPTPMACMLILKYILAISATEEEMNTLKTKAVNIKGTSV